MDGHAAIDTDALLEIANALSGLDATPPDSGVLYPGVGIRKVLLGHEIGAAELLLARQQGFDAVIAHQPFGLPEAWRAAEWHLDALIRHGVSRQEAEAAVAPALEAMAIESLSRYSERLAALARLLDVPLLVIHRPIDVIAAHRIQQHVDAQRAERPGVSMEKLVATFTALPEFASAPSAVRIVLGDRRAPAGSMLVLAGTLPTGGHAILPAYGDRGVETLICGPLAAEDLAALRAGNRGQVIALGSSVTAAIGLRAYAEHLESLDLEVATLAASS